MSASLSKEEVTALTGKNAEYYWTRWTPLAEGQDWTGFNWAAFFLTGLWLSYRKMYGSAMIFYAVLLLGFLADQLNDRTKETFASEFGWIIAVLCGAFGNRWYWSHAKSVADEVRTKGLDENNCYRALSKRGGTSILSAFAFLAGFAAVCFLILRRGR